MLCIHHMLLYLLLVALPRLSQGANFTLVVSEDARTVIDMGVFGYGRGVGHLEFEVKDFALHDDGGYTSKDKIGFTLDLVKSAVAARQLRTYGLKASAVEDDAFGAVCFIDDDASVSPKRFMLPLENILQMAYQKRNRNEDAGKSTQYHFEAKTVTVTIPEQSEGLYALFFYNCKRRQTQVTPVSFAVRVSQYVVDKGGSVNYVSIGERPVVWVDVCFAGLFICVTYVWHRVIYSSPEPVRRNVRPIHKVMYVLLVLKILTLITNLIMMWHRSTTGAMSGTLDVLHYGVQALKAAVLFAVMVLLGTGWSLIKPFLSERDLKILVVVLSLQITANIALSVIEEESEGAESWFNLRMSLRILDIVCCCIVLLPLVMWTPTGSATDDSQRQITRLQRFRLYYVVVVVYLYATRVLSPLLESQLSYLWLWLAHVAYESSALAFYLFSGSMFQPTGRGVKVIGDDVDPDVAAMVAPDVGEIQLDEKPG